MRIGVLIEHQPEGDRVAQLPSAGPLRGPPAGGAADPTLAIAAVLSGAMSLMVEGRVFRPELPEGEDPHMPRACMIVRPAGGGTMFGKDRLPVMDSRIDVICYGSSRLEAENVCREAQRVLKELDRGVYEKVIVFWARIAGGPVSAIDPNTNWPYALLTLQVMHALRSG